MIITRFRKFNTRDVYPGGHLDNDMCMAVSTWNRIFLRGQTGLDLNQKMIDPNDSTRYKKFNKKYSHEKLLIKIFEKGKLIYKCPSLKMIKQRLEDDLKMLDNSHNRLENPHSYPVGIEENLYKEKKKMILNLRK